jgi:serine/threonine-protein kinase
MTEASQRLQAALADRYRIERELGSGGMATVYLAEDLKHHRNVAIKVLREDLAASIGAARFLREIEIAAQLQHPNILTLLDSGNADGFLFYVMPYVSGQSLRERLSREGELPVQEAVRLLSEVVDALSHAHEHGVVHRDIKPDNVMLSGRHALVADFGVAKAVSDASGGGSGVTSVGLAVGTPAYMSPEQAAADPGIDHRSDIYSVGVMAYEMLTGRTPFVGATPQQVLAAQVTQTADPLSRYRPGLPSALEAVIMRCLEKRPSDRWQSASQLHTALEPFTTASSITPTDTAPHQRKSGGLGKPVAAGIAAVLLIGAVAWFTVGRKAAKSDGAPSSIAVIPFENLSSDTSMVYFADGMADEMANALSSIPGLRVMARTSAAAFEGKHATPQEIGKALNVDVVLMGSVRRNGDRLLVSAHVDRTSDGSQMFAERYDTAYTNVFQVEEDLARGVANRLQASLKPAAKTDVHALRGTDDIDAYDLYLKGEYLFAKRGGENLKQAIQYFDQAIARDPSFARAYAGRAMVYSVLPGWTALRDNTSLQKAEESARRAIQLDSTVVEGRLALANTLSALGRSADADREFVAALAMDPGNATGHQWRGANLGYQARGDEAIREGKAATKLDPLSAVAFSDLEFSSLLAHKWRDAIDAFDSARKLDPGMVPIYITAGMAYAELGKPDSAVWTWDEAYRLDPTLPGVRSYRVWRYAIDGKQAEAKNAFDEFNRNDTGSSRLNDMVVAQLGLGNRAAALDAIEAAARGRSFYVATDGLGCDPTYAALWKEPRFLAIVKLAGQVMCSDIARTILPASR